MDVNERLIFTTLQLALDAGKAIIEIYNTPFNVELKKDDSPLTIADKNAHSILSEGLVTTGLPVLSEEGIQPAYDIRKTWSTYWLVDPLDGTKEFVKRNGDFTVNIALIDNQQPVFGVVFAPVPGLLYWGSRLGSFRLDIRKHEIDFSTGTDIQVYAEKLPCVSGSENYLVLGSKSHMNAETLEFVDHLRKSHPDLSLVSRGSSLKFCTLAEGGADIYPRFGPTMEWDTAAGHAVALFAGCEIVKAVDESPLLYNKADLLNPFFIARHKK